MQPQTVNQIATLPDAVILLIGKYSPDPENLIATSNKTDRSMLSIHRSKLTKKLTDQRKIIHEVYEHAHAFLLMILNMFSDHLHIADGGHRDVAGVAADLTITLQQFSRTMPRDANMARPKTMPPICPITSMVVCACPPFEAPPPHPPGHWGA